MDLQIDGLSKRFARHWVFRDLSLQITSGTHVAVTGPNGSGKSTLLKILAGALPQSLGHITYRLGDVLIGQDSLHRHVSFAAPYAAMIEELTLEEAWRFQQRFKPWLPGTATIEAFKEQMAYTFDSGAPISTMSSGMKQRLRLAFALFTRSDLLILDEPTSNLDDQGILWFHEALGLYGDSRTVVIASNVRDDLRTCQQYVDLGKD